MDEFVKMIETQIDSVAADNLEIFIAEITKFMYDYS